MKYTWEASDIKPGVRVRHFSGSHFVVALAAESNASGDPALFVLYDEAKFTVTSAHDSVSMTLMLNNQGCVPLNIEP